MAAILPVFIPHAGCPQHCVFCNQRAIAGDFAIPSPEEIVRLAEEAAVKANRPDLQLAFYGGSFTALPLQLQKQCLDAASGLHLRGLISSVRMSTRPDAVDENILGFLSGYPVRVIELGAQSMADGVLRASERGHTAEHTVKAAKLVKSRGFELILQMMAGLPGERPGDAERTAEKLAALKPDGVRIYPVAVIRGTKLEDMYRSGEYVPPDVGEAAELCGRLIEFFEGTGIPVIRCGLNPSEDLRGEIVAGAYHPAFGELARSSVFLRKACELIDKLPLLPQTLNILVDKRHVSLMVGQRRKNIEAIREKYGVKQIRVRAAQLDGKMIEINVNE